MNLAPLLLESTLRFSVIAAGALVAARLLSRQSAALRHWIMAIAVACAAIMPLLELLLPAWPLPRGTISVSTGYRPIGSVNAPSPVPVSLPSSLPVSSAPDASSAATARIAGAAVAAGIAVNLAILVAGIWRLMRLASRARPLIDARWTIPAAEISQAYGLNRAVRLQQSPHPTLLLTWGFVRPVVILPRDAHTWSAERVRVVLCHELAHVQRGDWLAQIAAEVLRSLHWFNPLAWALCARMRQESEQAADDAVLRAGIASRDYAEHLLELARAASRHRTVSWPAPAIARPSTLERRVATMLDTTVNRTPLTRSARLACIVALSAIAIAVASAQGALARFSGLVVDPMNRTLPNVELVLTNVENNAKHEIRSDATGRFEFSGLPQGTYALEAKQLGFEMLTGRITLTGHDVQQDLQLQVGTLQETVTVTAAQANPDADPEPDPAQERLREEKRRQRERSALACGDTPHGGNIRPPMKMNNIRPQYPLHLGSAQVGGSVFLEGRIAKDGTMKEVHLVRGAHPDLDAAALTAIRQWRFDSTLLNCMPIEVAMKVRVNFTP
jgi:TonB family protein